MARLFGGYLFLLCEVNPKRRQLFGGLPPFEIQPTCDFWVGLTSQNDWQHSPKLVGPDFENAPLGSELGIPKNIPWCSCGCPFAELAPFAQLQ